MPWATALACLFFHPKLRREGLFEQRGGAEERRREDGSSMVSLYPKAGEGIANVASMSHMNALFGRLSEKENNLKSNRATDSELLL